MARSAAEGELVALFGGSFDPPHLGHLGLSRALLQSVEPRIARIHLVPAHTSPYKLDRPPAASGEERLAMLSLLLNELSRAERTRINIDQRELCRPPPSYTIDTLDSLQSELDPNEEAALVIGADTLSGLYGWHRADEILERHALLLFRRPPTATISTTGSSDPEEILSQLRTGHPQLRSHWIGAPLSDCASRNIRRGGQPDCLTPELRHYIERKQLY